ncbi:hypothetical protein B0F90DRAFT_1690502 [Multifurca ochricompacta]|uniref:Uncharacterized protein n=1 Tax=Multifurca ochricompacta TaxID=376703 RepID=A0AAD4MCD5_9AGAM|nr:hypothetical protein B0F90DRAFT_1690502 [Multifurca ochricompacta]
MMTDRECFSPAPAPAHYTKHIQLLNYHFLNHHLFILTQQQDSRSTGTSLWLGAQCLSLYLATVHKSIHQSPFHSRPRLLELGSGIGLIALAMNSLGWDVLATDTSHTISSVLLPNIVSNRSRTTCNHSTIEVRELDWLVPPASWDWMNPVAVATTTTYTPLATETQANDASLQPPFDLIISSDTIYDVELIQPLLRALYNAATVSRSPPVYLCIERRDPAVIDRALSEAKRVWGFTVTRIPHRKVSKAMENGGLKWRMEDWDGVEIWRLKLKNVQL